MLIAAAIQMTSSDQVEENLEQASLLIRQAVKQKASLISLPENFPMMGKTDEARLTVAEQIGSGMIQDFLSHQASVNKIWLIGGTIPILSRLPGKVYAASLLYSPDGYCFARYNKIHLFDVIADEESAESYMESETFAPGLEMVVANTHIGNIGLSVCYDLRFPELYRKMHQQQVEIISAPSAFTATTGKMHWELLLRSRAVENLSYVIASNQEGRHANGRLTWGHSMIVDPWGKILDCVKQGVGIALAEIDLDKQKNIRKTFPVLTHRKLNYQLDD
ncbi:MAG: carbon-nitrogen hydrolase family protein [Pseudomonadota bacterium]